MIAIPKDISDKITILVGDPATLDNRPASVWEPARVSFLSELSKKLIAHADAKRRPDVMSFAYWIRRANLVKMQERTSGPDSSRIGLGLVFHICPSNVPVNFAFSLAFALLSGNSSVLRLPRREDPTYTIIVEAINELLAEHEQEAIKAAILVVRYERDDDLNAYWLSQADGRIIWGGNQTVNHMRSFDVPPRSREIAFPDRYSLCALCADAILRLEGDALEKFCAALYNDIYLMDQAACSSPQLLAWTGKKDDVTAAQNKLWPAFIKHSKSRYEIKPIQVMEKFVDACSAAISSENVSDINRDDYVLYRYELNNLDETQDDSRGYSGTIHEVALTSLDELAPIVKKNYQTLSYFGFSKDELRSFVNENRLRGIDRIVPVGRALDMDIVWDGYDMISTLSRIVEIG